MNEVTKGNSELHIQGTQIESAGRDFISWVSGPKQNIVHSVLPPEKAISEGLVFVSNEKQLSQALEAQAKIIIALDKVLKDRPKIPDHLLLFTTKNISQSMARVLSLFDQKMSRFDWGIDLHPSATIHPLARLGKNVKVGPHAIIGAQAHIGDFSVIGAGTVVEKGARIGTKTLLHPQVFIGADCEIGSHCEIHPHTTIGSDGFGFASDENFKHHKISQLGKVIIEDRVEIGANCAIDRATLTATRIRAGSKFDNLCHVAHNCELGEDCLFAAGFFIAGSSKIGSRFMCGGNVAVTTHVELADGVILAGRSAVTNNITAAGQYGGYPLQPLKEALKTIANLGTLNQMRKNLHKIMKHLQLNDDN